MQSKPPYGNGSPLNPEILTKEYAIYFLEEYWHRNLIKNFGREEYKARWKEKLKNIFRVSSWFGLGPSDVTLHYISDNSGGGGSDPAIAEIDTRLEDIMKMLRFFSGIAPPKFKQYSSESQNVYEASYWLGQLARQRQLGAGSAYFINCAPRKKEAGTDSDNKGEDIYVAMLPNGAIVCGVGEHSFSMMRDLAKEQKIEIYRTKFHSTDTQFRSRDIFPYLTYLLAYNAGKMFGIWRPGLTVEERSKLFSQINFIDTKDVLKPDCIPDYSDHAVSADVHGNLKFATCVSDTPLQQIIAKAKENNKRAYVNVILKFHDGREKEIQALAGSTMFGSAGKGDIAISPSSAGEWPDSLKEDSRMLQIYMMHESFKEEFGITDGDMREGIKIKIDWEKPVYRPVRAPQPAAAPG